MENNIETVKTSISIKADQQKVWQKVGFYEHVQKKPSMLLKLSLPIPKEVAGKYSKVGDVCRCKYSDGGYLTKRITQIVNNNRIEFEIIEQSIRYQNMVKLLGGSIEVIEIDNNQSQINMVTNYENHFAPKFISKFFINIVIKSMHQFVIQDMQAELQEIHIEAEAC